MALVTDSPKKVPRPVVPAAPAYTAPTSTDYMALVPKMFCEPVDVDSPEPASTTPTSTDIMALVPAVFRQALPNPEETTPKKRKIGTFYEAVLATPAPPPKRGAIKSTCENAPAAATTITSSGPCTAYVERSLKGNVRTYLRVRVGDEKKRMWVEVRAHQHASHTAIIQEHRRQT